MTQEEEERFKIVRLEERQQEVLRRLGLLENKPSENHELTNIRIAKLEEQFNDTRRTHARLMWVVLVSLAGQILKLIGSSSLLEILK